MWECKCSRRSGKATGLIVTGDLPSRCRICLAGQSDLRSQALFEADFVIISTNLLRAYPQICVAPRLAMFRRLPHLACFKGGCNECLDHARDWTRAGPLLKLLFLRRQRVGGCACWCVDGNLRCFIKNTGRSLSESTVPANRQKNRLPRMDGVCCGAKTRVPLITSCGTEKRRCCVAHATAGIQIISADAKLDGHDQLAQHPPGPDAIYRPLNDSLPFPTRHGLMLTPHFLTGWRYFRARHVYNMHRRAWWLHCHRLMPFLASHE